MTEYGPAQESPLEGLPEEQDVRSKANEQLCNDPFLMYKEKGEDSISNTTTLQWINLSTTVFICLFLGLILLLSPISAN